MKSQLAHTGPHSTIANEAAAQRHALNDLMDNQIPKARTARSSRGSRHPLLLGSCPWPRRRRENPAQLFRALIRFLNARQDCKKLYCRFVFPSAPSHAQHLRHRAQNPAQSRSTRCRCSSTSWLGASPAFALRGHVLCTMRLCVKGGLPARLCAGN